MSPVCTMKAHFSSSATLSGTADLTDAEDTGIGSAKLESGSISFSGTDANGGTLAGIIDLPYTSPVFTEALVTGTLNGISYLNAVITEDMTWSGELTFIADIATGAVRDGAFSLTGTGTSTVSGFVSGSGGTTSQGFTVSPSAFSLEGFTVEGTLMDASGFEYTVTPDPIEATLQGAMDVDSSRDSGTATEITGTVNIFAEPASPNDPSTGLEITFN